MNERVTEIAICCGIEMNMGGKKLGDENLNVTIPNREYDRSKSARGCKIFRILW
jgi:hypothetical protein